jgi:uncharacterized Zn finger protein
MCKHVAAALYGTAVRLDEKPELFFTLRGIKVQDFVGTMVKRESRKILQKVKQKSSRAIVSDDAEVSALFGITMDSEKSPAQAAFAPRRRRKKANVGVNTNDRVAPRKRIKTALKKRYRKGGSHPGESS